MVRMSRCFLFACLMLAFCAPVRAAQMYMRGTPILISPKKTVKSQSRILERFAEVLRRRKEPKPVVKDGLGVMLQTAYRYYWEGENVDLFLQLFANDPGRRMGLSLLGSFFIEVEDLKNGKIEVGQYHIEDEFQEELVGRGSEVVGLGPATSDDHEVLAVFDLEDFAFVKLSEGVYRITIEYIDNSRPEHAWHGRIKSNPVIIEVIGGLTSSKRILELRKKGILDWLP